MIRQSLTKECSVDPVEWLKLQTPLCEFTDCKNQTRLQRCLKEKAHDAIQLV